MFFFFFFKQKTAYEMRISDWSSDVCSSDLSTESRATFGEIRVPIVASRSGETGGRVVATGAIRRESSDRFEKPIRTETIGLEVRPFKSLLLRSTYSSAFKPPIARRVILPPRDAIASVRSEEHTSELQSLMRISYAVF